MLVKNNTHYYSIHNKVYNSIPNTDSWEYESAKRMSYAQRLYWEYRYIKSCGGQAFFYTFTYNDASIPKFTYKAYDFKSSSYVDRIINCFNYDHIRLITNGIISKVLRRKYGSQLRYFVACERGEGKGKRGKGQNPHYHVIFFISPLPDSIRKPKDPAYKRISPIQFCHLCKCVWQYKSVVGKYDYIKADYKSAKFGHCEPGFDLGLVTDFDALSYVSKYVVKDASQAHDDLGVKEYYVRYFRDKGLTYHSLYSYYLYLRQDNSICDRQHFLDWSGISLYHTYHLANPRTSLSWYEYITERCGDRYSAFLQKYIEYHNTLYLPQIAEQYYRDYCNKYGCKVRTSKSLGLYGLDHIKDDSFNPHFVLEHSNKVLAQPICLYYFRKRYMNVVTCSHSGNPLYVLNEDGINLKCRTLSNSLDKCYRDTISALSDLANPANSELRSFFSDSGINSFDNDDLPFNSGISEIDNLSSHPRLTEFDNPLVNSRLSDIDNLLSDSRLNDIVNRYCVYRLVYQYRSFDPHEVPAISNMFCFENVLVDYRRFLESSFYSCDYNDLFLIKFIERNSDKVLSFNAHWAFASYIQYFELIESALTAYRRYVGDGKRKNFAESAKLRQKINAVKYAHVE